MGKEKKKYESGSATAFIGRNQAIKKLQLTLADFRRLCILKGIYPVEPKNKKRVNKGSTAQKTFYYVKDINFLANEPLISRFRAFKVYVKRLKRAKGRRDIKKIASLKLNKPSYKVDHIVRERYPTFTDALRDLDDCLSLIFLFSILPKSKRIYVERVHMCRRLSLEFMHYCIISKSLRKCFISIKGYYFQAEIKGQKVTWIMPHKLAYQTPDDVDFRIMSTFVEFYSIMLGFVNFKSYQDLGLIYPPKLAIQEKPNEVEKTDKSKSKSKKDVYDESDFNDEFLASLNCDFAKVSADENEAQNGDEFQLADEENPEALERARIEEENLRQLKVLFKGLKFFLNREVPKEQFVLAIRSFSGQVSWDSTVGLGSTYQEDDESITHQIIDRPLHSSTKTYLSRVYVQPQWVFDCINENRLLPVDEYLPGAVLPPHLSPFVDAAEGDYVPPEKQRLIKMKLGLLDEEEDKKQTAETQQKLKQQAKKESELKKEEEVVLKKNDKRRKVEEEPKKEEEEDSDLEDHGMRVDLDSAEEEESDEETEISESEDEETKAAKNKAKKPIIAVAKGKAKTENLNMVLKKKADEEKKLNEMMIPKKNKRLYDKIMHSRKKKKQENEKLKQKREIYEDKQKKIKTV